MSSKPQTRVAGSMLKKVIASELVAERANCNFDRRELENILTHPDEQRRRAQNIKEMEEVPGFANTHKFYEYTENERQDAYWRKLKIAK
jgi:hypothetical protein